jgi:hypothetical protein
MFSTFFRSSLNDLLLSYTRVLESISSANFDLSLTRISAGFIFPLVRKLTTMRCAASDGTTCSLIVISTDKKQADTQ